MLDLLFFESNGHRYAVEASHVESIAWRPELSPVDGVPMWFSGHLNWHGQSVPVVDWGLLLGHPSRPRELNDQLIVLSQGDDKLALMVSSVKELATFTESDITVKPQSGHAEALPFCAELRDGDHLLMVLDVALLTGRVHRLVPGDLQEPGDLGLASPTVSHLSSDAAAKVFLDRMHRLAETRAAETATVQSSYALVHIGERRYAIPLTRVVEFAHLKHYAPLPGMPSFIVGCMNLRGEALCIIDLSQFLRLSPSNNAKQVVVLAGENKRLAIRINSIERIIQIDDSTIESIGETEEQRPLAHQLVHLPEEVIAVLDVDALLKGNLLDVFEQA